MIENFGQNLARLRKEKGLTQKELAEILKMNKQTIYTLEKGEGYPTFKKLEMIAQFFDVGPIELFGTEKEIMTADVPTILEEIDKSKEILRTVFKAEKILKEIQGPIQKLVEDLTFIEKHKEIIQRK